MSNPSSSASAAAAASSSSSSNNSNSNGGNNFGLVSVTPTTSSPRIIPSTPEELVAIGYGHCPGVQDGSITQRHALAMDKDADAVRFDAEYIVEIQASTGSTGVVGSQSIYDTSNTSPIDGKSHETGGIRS